ncbi:tetratricopeptide repeat protein [Streptomyces milbemycinicus]|uniref:tetratricopeptide repeat protein n=1 Tax=Streptomyces milbemycinicus TaxID=476552 RepID=UPI0033CE8FAE
MNSSERMPNVRGGMTRDGAQGVSDALTELRRELRDALHQARWTQDTLASHARLGRTTINQALSSNVAKPPSRNVVSSLVKALKLKDRREYLLGLHAEAEEQWGGSHERDVSADAADVPGSGGVTAGASAPLGLPVADLDDAYALEHLEVHRSIDPGLPTLSTLPPYVRREHDEWLAGVAREAENASRMAVLVGDSSTGKTRALYGMLRLQELAGWHVWQPHTPERLLTACRRREIGPRTVVWMNETQGYLKGPLGRETASALRALLADPAVAPVLVLGTLWRSHHSDLTLRPHRSEPDPHEQARRLLDGRCRVVPEEFDDHNLERLARLAPQDRRLALAVERGGRRIPQFLAGAQELERLFETAPNGARAVIRAAMDARRLGHGPLLGAEFLEAAAPGHLDDEQWQLLNAAWFEEALHYSGQECKGVPGPLTPHRPRPGETSPSGETFLLADYLEHYARDAFRYDVPPTAFWTAAVRHVTRSSDLIALADSAEVRFLLRPAAELYRAAAEAGAPRGWLSLGRLHARANDPACATEFFRSAAEAGEFHGHIELARMRMTAGDTGGALGLYQAAARQAAASAGPSEAGLLAMVLAAPLAKAGDPEGAEELCRALIASGGDDQWLWAYAAKLRMTAEDREGAESHAREAARRGDNSGMLELAEAWRSVGDEARADRLYDEVIELSTSMMLGELASSVEKTSPAQAERLYRIIDEREGGSPTGLWIQAARLLEAGDSPGAEELFRACVDAGDPAGLDSLGQLCLDAEDWDGAERYAVRDLTETGSSLLLHELDLAFRDSGQRDRLLALYRQLADDGFTAGLTGLARLLDEAGEHTEADHFALKATAAGDSTVLWMLVRRDDPRHRRLLRYGLEPDGSAADPWCGHQRPP